MSLIAVNCGCCGCPNCFTDTTKAIEDVTYNANLSGFGSLYGLWAPVSLAGPLVETYSVLLSEYNSDTTLEWVSSSYDPTTECDYLHVYEGTSSLASGVCIISTSGVCNVRTARILHRLTLLDTSYPAQIRFTYEMILQWWSGAAWIERSHIGFFQPIQSLCAGDNGSLADAVPNDGAVYMAAEWEYDASAKELSADLSHDPSYPTGSMSCPCALSGTTTAATGQLLVTVDP